MLCHSLLLVTTLVLPAHAAMLRPYTEINGPTVRLGDLFDQLGTTPDRVLGRGPMPGDRILVGAAQLAAIARDFGVDWRPSTGSERAVIERRASTVPQRAIADAIRKALLSKGAPDLSDIAMPDAQPFLIPANLLAAPEITDCSYDASTGRFTSLVSIAVPDAPPQQQRVSGAVIPMTYTAVAKHHIARNTTISAADVQTERVRLQLLRGNEAVSETAVVGQTVKHDMAPGQPLSAADIFRPALVTSGNLVRMDLSVAGIILTAQGIARGSGAMGDRIRVENPSSHALVEAHIVAEDEVRVDPGNAPLALAAVR